MKQVKKVVILPTENLSNIWKDDRSSILFYNGRQSRTMGHHHNQHLYILSDDGSKIGEWTIFTSTHNDTIEEYNSPIKVEYDYASNGLYNFKVIASTDKSITPNSWIPDSFVETYVKAYNEGKPITEVSLEM